MKNENKKKEIINSKYKFIPNYILRCSECNLIPFLELKYNKGKPSIKSYCENKHSISLNLEDYLNNYQKFSLSNEICKECGKKQNEINQSFFYCSCNKFLCFQCSNIHDNNYNHNIIHIKRYDSFCKKHLNSFIWFCLNCKKNICIYCKKEHIFHQLILLPDFDFDEKLNLKNKIKNFELMLKNLDKIKEKLLYLINKLKDLTNLELKYLEKLISTYEYEKNQKNINFNVINNIKLWEESSKLNQLESLLNEGKKYINLLKNYIEYHLDNIENCITIIKGHSKSITHLDKLKDGRLISSSLDFSLNIYKKKIYEIQLSIKEHNGNIYYFTQLKDERIITCSSDKTMKIIKLKGENQYHIDQTLQFNNCDYKKVIEIQNHLISISPLCNIKLWKLDNSNIFFNNYYKSDDNNVYFSNSNNSNLVDLLYNNILKLNEKEFVVSSKQEKNIVFFYWNLGKYSIISKIKNIETGDYLSSMCLLDDNLLCIGGINSKGYYLIDLLTYSLIKNITGTKIIYSINKCSNGFLLSSVMNQNNLNNIIKLYNDDKLTIFKEKENAHDNIIISVIELDDQTIISGGNDNLIKIWNK